MKIFFEKILELLFPQKCLGCKKSKVLLCDECLEKIDHGENDLSNTHIASTYHVKTIKRAIWFLKYHKIKTISKPLSKLLYIRTIKHLKATGITKWLIIPIPLSSQRLRQRGFNQSELIGHHFSVMINERETMSIKEINHVLYRKLNTPTQVSIKDRAKRLKNMKNVFGVKNYHLVKKQNIILIDDVTTTGATLSEAKKVLKKAGATEIICLAIASG